MDIRVTSEIILAHIILAEKFPNLPSETKKLTIVPMMPDPEAMLAKADAALIVNLSPSRTPQDLFCLDLVEEWNDMTGLPYVHGMWVVREAHFSDEEVRRLLEAKGEGIKALTAPASPGATGLSSEEFGRYFNGFSYEMGDQQKGSLEEFFRFAFYHGALGDIPELNFFAASSPPQSLVN